MTKKPAKAAKPEKPILHLKSQAAFRKWLEKNHGDEVGVWLKLAKKNGKVPAPNYDEALEEALCFGWIDGQVKRFDDDVYLQSFTPRRKRSPWSARNVKLVAGLIESGQMEVPGFEAIQQAKDDGRWDKAYDGAASYEQHPDFLEALEADAEAKAAYGQLSSVNRFAIYFQIHAAKRADTRQRRIEKFVAMLARGETPH